MGRTVASLAAALCVAVVAVTVFAVPLVAAKGVASHPMAHLRRLNGDDGRPRPALFLVSASNNTNAVSQAVFDLVVTVEAAAQTPADHPDAAQDGNVKAMAPQSSPYVSLDMQAVADVQIVVALPAGVLDLRDIGSEPRVTQRGTTVAGATVDIAFSMARSSAALHLNPTLFPSVLEVTSTVDTVTATVPSLSAGASVTLHVPARIPSGTVTVGTLPPYAVGASFEAVNATGGSSTTYATAATRSISLVCDAAVTCNGAGSCRLQQDGAQQQAAVCVCIPSWQGAGCEEAVATCAGMADPVVFSLEMPEWDSGEQWFAFYFLSALLVATLVRVLFCCSTSWGQGQAVARSAPRAAVSSEEAQPLKRNWRNVLVVIALAVEAIQCAAPAFQGKTRWPFFVPVKLASRVSTAEAVHWWWLFMPLFALACAASLAALVGARLSSRRQRRQRRRRRKVSSDDSRGGSRSRAARASYVDGGSKGSADLGGSLDASLAMPDIVAGSDDGPTVVAGTGEVSMAGTAAPSAQTRGWVAVLVYLLATVLFQPTAALMLRVWSCGFPFRPYAHNGAASEECLLPQECWQVPHLAACAVSAVCLPVLLSVATVTFAHVQATDSPSGTSRSRLPPSARLQARRSTASVLLVVVAKVLMLYADMVWSHTAFEVRLTNLPVPVICAAVLNVLLFLWMLLTSPFANRRLQLMARLAYGLSMCTALGVVALHVYEEPDGTPVESSLSADLDVAASTEPEVLVAGLAWAVCATLCVLAFVCHRRVSKLALPLWRRPPPKLGGDGSAKEWTGSFRVVNGSGSDDWRMDNWSGSLEGSNAPFTTDDDAKQGPTGTTPRVGAMPRADRFRGEQEFKSVQARPAARLPGSAGKTPRAAGDSSELGDLKLESMLLLSGDVDVSDGDAGAAPPNPPPSNHRR